MVRSGDRTSTPIALRKVPVLSYVVTDALSCLVRPPPSGNDRVFHPRSITFPSCDTHR